MSNNIPSSPFYTRLAHVLLSLCLIVLLMYLGRTIIIPLFFSFLITLLLLPFCKFLERMRLPVSIAAIISILSLLVLLGGLFSTMAIQMGDFFKDIPELGVKMQGWTHDLQNVVWHRLHVNYSKQMEYVKKGTDGIVSSATDIAQTLVLRISGIVIWTIFILIFTFFTLTHRALLKRFITGLFSDSYQGYVVDAVSDIKLLANGYILGLLIEMVIVAVLNCGAFFIFGIRFALLLGVLGALLNIIPYIGIYTAAALAGLVTLSNNTPGHALTAIIIMMVIHFIDANMLMPRIVGSRVKMNPLITIVAVLAGNLLWGIAGMFLFIPLTAILKIIFERVEGLKPWAILIGTDADINKEKQKEADSLIDLSDRVKKNT